MKIALGFAILFYSPFLVAQSNSDNWKKGGNAVDPGDFFGSTNLADITIKTNDLPRAVFTADGHIVLIPSGNGNVGIGTSAPGTSLDVNGVTHTTSLFADQLISTDTLKVSTILNVLDKICIESDPLGGSICGKAFPLKIQSDPLFNSNTVINANNTGFVGIGTDNPQSKLDVNGELRVTSLIKIGSSLYLTNYTSPAPANEIYTDDADLLIQSNPITSYPFNTILNAELNTGHVGIGTKTPVKKLHVYSSHTLNTPEPVEPSLSFGNDETAEPVPPPLGTHNGMRLEERTTYTTSQNPPQTGTWDIEPFPKKLFFGTPSNKFFILKDNGANDGRVGIGTSNPRARLDVTGDFVLGNANEKFIFDARSANGDFLHITYQNANGQWDYANGITLRDNGKVGIGTTTPSHKLEVAGSALITGFACIGGTNQHAKLTVEVPSSNDKAFAITDPNSPTDPLQDAFTIDGAGSLKAKGDAFIKGRVRIGNQSITSGPHTDYSLSVDGKIVAKSCYVTVTGWADFAYAPDYALMSLKKRKELVFSEFHMPYLKSAKEIEKNGANIGEILNGLTHNLEDHDHYLFDHESRLEKLEKENADLKRKNEELAVRLQKLEMKVK